MGSSTTTLENITIDGNLVSSSSSMIYVGGGNLNIEDGTNLKNAMKTISKGGAIYIYRGNVTINGGIIQNNQATSYGGAIYADGDCVLTFNDGIIRNNKTTFSTSYGGGAIYARDCKFYMNGGLMSNNSSGGKGGAIFNTSYATSFIHGGTIDSLNASNGGLGNAVYHNLENKDSAELHVGGDAQINSDIYLKSGKYIQIDSPMDYSVTLVPQDYTDGTVIAEGYNYSLSDSDNKKIIITPKGNTRWYTAPNENNQIVLTSTPPAYLQNTVYVDQSRGSSTGIGAENDPVATIQQAKDLLASDGKIVIVGAFDVSKDSVWEIPSAIYGSATIQVDSNTTTPAIAVTSGKTLSLGDITVEDVGSKVAIYVDGGATYEDGAMTTVSGVIVYAVKSDCDMSAVSFNSVTRPYNGSPQSPTVIGTLPTGVTVSYAGSATDVSDGTQTVTASFTGDSNRYNPIPDMTATITIAPKSVSATWTGTSVVYNEVQNLTVTPVGLIGEDTTDIALSYSDGEETFASVTDIGSYTVTAILTNSNYTLSNPTATFTISQAPVTFTVTDNQVAYTGSAQYATITNDKNLVLDTDYTISYTNSSDEPVATPISAGSYSIYANILNSDYSHVATSSATKKIGELTITPAESPAHGISFQSATVPYDGNAHSLSVTGTIPEGLSVSYSGSATNVSDGAQTVTASFTWNSENYEPIPDMTATITITPKPVSAIWTGTSAVYNGVQNLTVTPVGLLGADTTGIILTYSDGHAAYPSVTNVGSFAVTATPTNTNYTLSNPTATFTISQAPVTFTVMDNKLAYTGSAKYATVTNNQSLVPDTDYTISYINSRGEIVAEPIEYGIYGIYATITNPNFRHASTADGAATQIGVLNIYSVAPPTYSMTFSDGTSPITDAVAGTVHTLPVADVFTKTENEVTYHFTGWKYNDVMYKAGKLFTQPNGNVMFIAQYEEVHDINVTVRDCNGALQSNAVVTLMQGSREIDSGIALDGTYLFAGVPLGTYNVIASYGGVTKTAIVSITSENRSIEITLPEGITNSVVEVVAGTPDVVVGGLDEVFTTTDSEVYTEADVTTVSNGGSVELALTVKEVTNTVSSSTKTNLETLVSNVGTYLDINIKKTVKDEHGTVTDTVPSVPTVPGVLKFIIPIPAEYQGKESYSIVREHNGVAQVITTEPVDGEYIQVFDTELHLYAKYFSTYALAYVEPVVEPPSGGGGVSIPSYSSNVTDCENGSVTIDKSMATEGTKITITAKPDEGYEMGTVKVTDVSGNQIAITDNGDGTYSFIQPSKRVTIAVTFIEIHEEEISFVDVATSDWFYDEVKWAVTNGITNGTTTTTFSPNISCTRGMIATILWRMSGQQDWDMCYPYADVEADEWYTDAIYWCTVNGVVTGYGDDRFGPQNLITREQLAAMLYRYAQYLEMDVSVGENTNILSYTDALDISDYAFTAIQWACGSGIIDGTTESTLSPRSTATRAQVVTMLMRFSQL